MDKAVWYVWLLSNAHVAGGNFCSGYDLSELSQAESDVNDIKLPLDAIENGRGPVVCIVLIRTELCISTVFFFLRSHHLCDQCSYVLKKSLILDIVSL